MAQRYRADSQFYTTSELCRQVPGPKGGRSADQDAGRPRRDEDYFAEHHRAGFGARREAG